MIFELEILLAMEVTCVKTLQPSKIYPLKKKKITLTFGCVTYRFSLTCGRKALRSRLREADPIASYWTQQCVPVHKPWSING